MSRQRQGFTIVEVMLFLAITGLMIAGAMAAVSGTINRQRYTEAVNSFHDYLQGQYSLVSSVRNNRPDTAACGAGGVTLGGTIDGRGTSNCTIAGRYIRTDGAGGRTIKSSPVYARADVASPDIQAPDPSWTVAQRIGALRLVVAPDELHEDQDTYRMAWDTNIYTDPDNIHGSGEFALLMIRMPTDSLTYTFTRLGPAPTDLSTMIGGALASRAVLCVNSNGLALGAANGVRILPDAINTNSIQYATGDDCR